MKYLLLLLLLFVLTLELPAKEANKNNAALSKKYPVDGNTEGLSTGFKVRMFTLPTTNAGTRHIGLNDNDPAAIYAENLSPEKRIYEVDYLLPYFRVKDYLRDTSIIWNQSSSFAEMGTFSNVEPNSQYHLTSTDIHDFFSHSTYGRQFLKGTKLWVGVGMGMMGTLMLMPRSVTRWEDDYIQDALYNLNESFASPPVWDEDHWPINYIGHPYAGSIYYNTLRCQGANPPQSFLFSAFISSGWEYLYEGFAERPSIQDLVVTPVFGSVLGELTHQATLKMKKNGCNFFEKVFITVLNPVHVVFKGLHP
jgi:hypothetical protein